MIETASSVRTRVISASFVLVAALLLASLAQARVEYPATQTLSEAGQHAFGPAQVAVDSQGRATVVWQRSDGTNLRIQATRGVILLPDTQIDSGPAEGATINDATPSFAVSGSPAAEVERFECRVDAGAFATCTSPQTTGPLADGPHSFAVRALDSDDDPDPPPPSAASRSTKPRPRRRSTPAPAV